MTSTQTCLNLGEGAVEEENCYLFNGRNREDLFNGPFLLSRDGEEKVEEISSFSPSRAWPRVKRFKGRKNDTWKR